MHITGEMVIGQRSVRGTAGAVQAVDPSRNAPIEQPQFGLATNADVDAACVLAEKAFDVVGAESMVLGERHGGDHDGERTRGGRRRDADDQGPIEKLMSEGRK